MKITHRRDCFVCLSTVYMHTLNSRNALQLGIEELETEYAIVR